MIGKRRILYLGCHEVLEYDDLRMFTDLGHEVFSLGHFTEAGSPTLMRKGRPEFYSPTDFENFLSLGGDVATRTLPKNFVKTFDLVIIVHVVDWVLRNAEALSGTPLIYRSIGQSVVQTEQMLASVAGQLRIVRYSVRELQDPTFLPSDRAIYFGKYKEDFPKWSGGDRISTFYNNYPHRPETSAPMLGLYLSFAERFSNLDLYGLHNEGIPSYRGVIGADEQYAVYATASLYLYIHTLPPSYTLNLMEAMFVGVPILAPSHSLVAKCSDNATVASWQVPAGRYEVPNLLGNNRYLLYDDLEDLCEKATYLTTSAPACDDISRTLRSRAHEFFDAAVIKYEWQDLFDGL